MRRFSLISGSLAALALGLGAACNDPLSRSPTTPTSTSSVIIEGPDSVAPGQSAQYTAKVRFGDGSTKSVLASNVAWSSNVQFFTIVRTDPSGLVTGFRVGEATLTADVALPGGPRRASKEIVVVPQGTFRLVGTVSDAEFPALRLSGARVEAGSLVTTTDADGQFRLYGVPPGASLRITRTGYEPLVQNLDLTGHVTRNFELALSGPRVSISGPHTLTIDATGPCSSLPADLRHREYEADVKPNGVVLEVTLTEPRFRMNSTNKGHRFIGHADAAGVTFTLDQYSSRGGYYYYYYYTGPSDYPSVAERLPDGTFLVPQGQAVMTATGTGLTGQLNGAINRWGSGFPTTPSLMAGCFATSHRFTLTPR